MNISILTLFPGLYEPFLSSSLIGRARESEIVDFDLASFFSYVEPKKRIDAPTFGPTAGMLIKPEITQVAIEDLESKHGPAYKIFFSPHGKKLDQKKARELAHKIQEKLHVMLVCSRYEGMDARVEEYYADEIISIGDYVLMGGDLPAMVLLEAVLRYVPGVIGKQDSVEQDSFSGPFVDYPEYTEPVNWKDISVPDIVRSGNHGQIEKWRLDKAVQRTVIHHFDWFRSSRLTQQQRNLAQKHIPSHYAALLHSQVQLRSGEVGNTSVTSLDLHDIARSARTYDIKQYFMMTELVDQQRIVRRFLEFWESSAAIDYNPHRHEAVSRISIASTLNEIIAVIEKNEGKAPIIIATSARQVSENKFITFYDQELIWAENRPVLLLLGTGGGLGPEQIEKSDYVLVPIEGLSDFNHLSVRSAAAIIFDRWLGLSIK